MVSKQFTINNKSGLHVRPAGVLVKVIQKFKSNINLKFNEKDYNAKSILGIMSACVKANDTIEFIIEGEDEQEAMDAIAQAIEEGLGE